MPQDSVATQSNFINNENTLYLGVKRNSKYVYLRSTKFLVVLLLTGGRVPNFLLRLFNKVATARRLGDVCSADLRRTS